MEIDEGLTETFKVFDAAPQEARGMPQRKAVPVRAPELDIAACLRACLCALVFARHADIVLC